MIRSNVLLRRSAASAFFQAQQARRSFIVSGAVSNSISRRVRSSFSIATTSSSLFPCRQQQQQQEDATLHHHQQQFSSAPAIVDDLEELTTAAANLSHTSSPLHHNHINKKNAATTVSVLPSLPPLPTHSQPLGYPLPTDEHACSVSLPTWSSVVGYEEGTPSVTNAMLCGYPRFVYHPYVKQLMAWIVQAYGSNNTYKEDCLVLPSKDAAYRCQVFIQQAWEAKQQQQQQPPSTTSPDIALVSHANISPSSSSRVRLVEVTPNFCYAVLFPADPEATRAAKAYWQHTGELVSSPHLEQTQQMQQNLGDSVNGGTKHMDNLSLNGSTAPATQLRQRIAQWANVPSADHVFLTPSGMSAIYTVLRSARRRHMADHKFTSNHQEQSNDNTNNGGRSVVYGFPYLDTLKMCGRPELCPCGVSFFGKGNAQDLQQLKDLLAAQKATNDPNAAVSVLFTEVPSNPLLHCPDLVQLRELADEYDFVLAVDDTISGFVNVDLMDSGLADVVCTSLTKQVSGRGDAIAGSCVVNNHTKAGQWLQQDLMQQDSHNPHVNGLYCPDALAILRNSADFEQRVWIMNHTAEVMADWLKEHPDVERVYYPKFSPSVDLYHRLLKGQSKNGGDNKTKLGGYGGLLSIVLHPHVCQRTFYDALDVAKGPSLGTNFTLVCPYTLLAHYHELDFAVQYDVPPNLLRVSIGLESVEELQNKFSAAFATSRLYPKVTMTTTTTTTKDAMVDNIQNRR
ncbi:hypothetical protein ACA910_008190 [Epithemia clementina (nom. ined.)]